MLLLDIKMQNIGRGIIKNNAAPFLQKDKDSDQMVKATEEWGSATLCKEVLLNRERICSQKNLQRCFPTRRITPPYSFLYSPTFQRQWSQMWYLTSLALLGLSFHIHWNTKFIKAEIKSFLRQNTCMWTALTWCALISSLDQKQDIFSKCSKFKHI